MTGPKRWVEPVVRELINAHDGRPPEPLVERYADKLRAEQDRFPIDPSNITAKLGIDRTLGPRDFAARIWVDERDAIRLDLGSHDPFIEAHALMHTAFPGFAEERRYRLDTWTERNPPNRQEEYLCDLGADALLMPRDLVRGRFDPRDGFEAVQRLAAEAQVSLEAAASRLVAVSDEPVVFVCMAHTNAPSDRPLIRQGDVVFPRWRTRYATARMVPLSVPRFSTPDERSPLAEAFRDLGGRVTDRLPGGEISLFDIDLHLDRDRAYLLAWPANL